MVVNIVRDENIISFHHLIFSKLFHSNSKVRGTEPHERLRVPIDTLAMVFREINLYLDRFFSDQQKHQKATLMGLEPTASGKSLVKQPETSALPLRQSVHHRRAI